MTTEKISETIQNRNLLTTPTKMSFYCISAIGKTLNQTKLVQMNKKAKEISELKHRMQPIHWRQNKYQFIIVNYFVWCNFSI